MKIRCRVWTHKDRLIGQWYGSPLWKCQRCERVHVGIDWVHV